MISLHHKKGGKKDSGDSWTITSSSKPSRKSSSLGTSQDEDEEEQEEESQLLHVVSKGNRQQTIKIKPLHKPHPTEEETIAAQKQTASRHTKKSRQSALPPISIQEDSNVSVKEESGIKLKLILSPKDKGKSADLEMSKRESRPSRDKPGKSPKGKVDEVKAKLMFGDQVLSLAGTKVTAQSQKRKHSDNESEQTPVISDSSKGNKRRKILDTEKTAKMSGKDEEKVTSLTRSGKKGESPNNISSKEAPKSPQKTPSRSAQVKTDNKNKPKMKPSGGSNTPSSDTSKDDEKSKKKKSKSGKTGNVNLLSVDESLEELVIDESKSEDSQKKIKSNKTKPDKKKKKSTESETHSSHKHDKAKKHKSKDPKKQKAKFITTGTKKPSRNIGLDPVTASHMFGQFDSSPGHIHSNLDLKSPSPGLDDESFFMAGNDATSPGFSSDFMGLSGLGDLGLFGKTKKPSKKSSKKGDKDKKKKRKKEKTRKGGKGQNAVTKVILYSLFCITTLRIVVKYL